jgi:hypothetical protein
MPHPPISARVWDSGALEIQNEKREQRVVKWFFLPVSILYTLPSEL